MQSSPPSLLASSLIPPEYTHSHYPGNDFYNNITGFYREAHVHPLNLTSGVTQPMHDTQFASHFWRHLDSATLSGFHRAYNGTLAEDLRGTFDWDKVDKFEMNVKERLVTVDWPSSELIDRGRSRDELQALKEEYRDWAWIKGSATLFTSSSTSDSSVASASTEGQISPANPHEMTFSFYGLHYLPNGTYALIAKPDGYRIDIRDIPPLFKGYGDIVHNTTVGIISRELEKDVKREEGVLISNEVRGDPGSKLRFLNHGLSFVVPCLPRDCSSLVLIRALRPWLSRYCSSAGRKLCISLTVS